MTFVKDQTMHYQDSTLTQFEKTLLSIRNALYRNMENNFKKPLNISVTGKK